MNNKAISSALAVILIIIIIAAIVGGAWALGGSPPEAAATGLKVEFNSVPQTWNDTIHQQLNWGPIAPSMSYTKNVTVTNQYTTPVTLILYTTEPAGCTQNWPKNNSQLLGNLSTSADLTLTTGSTISAGTFTWLLIASNSTTTPTPTPTTNPSATPTPTLYNCTIKVNGAGIQSVNVTNIGKGSYLITAGNFPLTLQFTSGDTLKFEATVLETYTFNAYTFSDGSFPYNQPTYTCTATGNFEITAEALLTG